MKQVILEDMLKHMEHGEVIREGQDGFIKDRLCLSNHGLQQWSDYIQEELSNVIYWDFCKATHTVPQKKKKILPLNWL